MKAVIENGRALKYVKNEYKTEEMCLIAVKQSGVNLQYVENQTEEICLEAVKNRGQILRFVKNQTEKVCIEALNSNMKNMKYLNEDMKAKMIEKGIISAQAFLCRMPNQ